MERPAWARTARPAVTRATPQGRPAGVASRSVSGAGGSGSVAVSSVSASGACAPRFPVPRPPNLPYAPNVSLRGAVPNAPKRPNPRVRVAGGRGSLGRRASATAVVAVAGGRPGGSGWPGPGGGGRRPARRPPRRRTAGPTGRRAGAGRRGGPASSPGWWTGPSSGAETAMRRPGPRPTADSPGRGRVPGSVRATASARYTVAASGSAHQARRSAAASAASGWFRAWPRQDSSRKPVPAEAAATSSRRSWTAGRAARVRRRASTRPGLPRRGCPAAARCAPGVRPAG